MDEKSAEDQSTKLDKMVKNCFCANYVETYILSPDISNNSISIPSYANCEEWTRLKNLFSYFYFLRLGLGKTWIFKISTF